MGCLESWEMRWKLTGCALTEKNVAECISDDALVHFKSYKYSSVDMSPVSKYVLGPFVCALQASSYFSIAFSTLLQRHSERFHLFCQVTGFHDS